MYIRKHLSLVRISSMTRQGSSLEPARMHSHERFVKDFSEGIIFENGQASCSLGHGSRYDSGSPGRVLFTWSSWNLLFQHNIWSYHLWFRILDLIYHLWFRILDLIDLLGSICIDFFLCFFDIFTYGHRIENEDRIASG